MPRKGNKRVRRRGKSSKSFTGLHWLRVNDFAGGVIGPGDRANWLRSSLSVQTDRDFWLQGFELQAVSESSAGSVGACIQVSVNNPSSTSSNNFWNTGPIIVGNVPFRKYFKITGTVPFSKDVATASVLLFVDNICQRAADVGSLRYVLRLDLKVSPEAFERSCPTYLPVTSNLFPL